MNNIFCSIGYCNIEYLENVLHVVVFIMFPHIVYSIRLILLHKFYSMVRMCTSEKLYVMYVRVHSSHLIIPLHLTSYLFLSFILYCITFIVSYFIVSCFIVSYFIVSRFIVSYFIVSYFHCIILYCFTIIYHI